MQAIWTKARKPVCYGVALAFLVLTPAGVIAVGVAMGMFLHGAIRRFF